MKLLSLFVSFMVVSTATGFAPQQWSKPAAARTTTQLDMMSPKRIGAALLLGTYLTFNTAPALAEIQDNAVSTDTTSILISARSGGRSGGRASSGRSYSRPSSVTRSSTSRTTIIQQPSVMVAPPVYSYGYSPFGFGMSPFGGLGLGLSAASSVGGAIRDVQQDSEIARDRAALEQARVKEVELEARIRQLEQASGGQQQQQQAPVAAQKQ